MLKESSKDYKIAARISNIQANYAKEGLRNSFFYGAWGELPSQQAFPGVAKDFQV